MLFEYISHSLIDRILDRYVRRKYPKFRFKDDFLLILLIKYLVIA